LKQFRLSVCAAAALALAPLSMAQTPASAPVTAPATAPAIDPAKVVMKVGDETMTAQQYNDLVNDVLPEQARAMAQGRSKRMFAEKIVDIKLLAAEARRQGMEKDPKIQRQMELLRQQVLAQAVVEKTQKSGDEAAAKKYYDEHKTEFEQAKARHILIRVANPQMPAAPGKKDLSDAEAKKKADEIVARLAKGEDFAVIAKAESDDPGSGSRGGDLGSFGRGNMVGEFDNAVFSQKIGEVGSPVKTMFGYHIIQVQERKTQAFDDVKQAILEKQGPAKVEALIESLKKSQKVEMDDAFFGKPMPQMPMEMPADQ
jgi:peptidyl-prolyl cis-trans isomerase C